MLSWFTKYPQKIIKGTTNTGVRATASSNSGTNTEIKDPYAEPVKKAISIIVTRENIIVIDFYFITENPKMGGFFFIQIDNPIKHKHHYYRVNKVE